MAEIYYFIGKEVVANHSLAPPYRVFLISLDHGKLLGVSDYSAQELQRQIAKRRCAGEDVAAHLEAYASLCRLTSTS